MKELYEPKMVLNRHCTNELRSNSACIYVASLKGLKIPIMIYDECVDASLQFSPVLSAGALSHSRVLEMTHCPTTTLAQAPPLSSPQSTRL
jgi:hypothetical protein